MLHAGRFISPMLVTLLAFAACGKRADDSAPLAFVPADTPFVVANIQPFPDPAIAAWSRQMEGTWPLLTTMFQRLVGTMPADGSAEPAAVRRVVGAVLDEIKQRDTTAKWAEVGLSAKARAALYGIGLVPVLRAELSDADAFRAMVARIERSSGTRLGTARIADQDVWIVDAGKLQGLIAIEGAHLVISVLPAAADEALKRRVLGLDRPQRSLAESGGLAALEKAERFAGFGSGWVDVRRIVALIDNDPGYAAFAALLDVAPPKIDAPCRAEFDAIAARAPRLVFGYTAFEATRMTFAGRLDLDPELAKSVAALSTPPPGSAAPLGALYDLALSLSVLKIKDFMLERVDAIVAAPFRCAALAWVNEAAIGLKPQLAQFVPPPFSDFTGVRVTIDRLSWPADGSPDLAAKLLIASSNPMAIAGMAQLALPALRDFKFAADGKAVTLPSGIVPNEVGFLPQIRVAISANAIVIGTGDDADLSAYLVAPVATDGQLMRAAYTGALYETMNAMITRFTTALPDQERAGLEQQQKLYAMYARWIKSVDLRINATDQGIEFSQEAELAE